MSRAHAPAGPHGPLESVFDDIWFVRGAVKMPMIMPMTISRSMTILRHRSEGDAAELTLVNSMRLGDAGLKALDQLGKVTRVIRIAGFHGRDDGFYRDRYGAQVFALEGQRYARSMKADPKPGSDYMEPDARLGADTPLPIPGATLHLIASSSPAEGIIRLDRDGGILITGDSLQNTPEPDEYVNAVARFAMKRMGFFSPYAIGAGWLQFAKPSAAEVRAIGDLDFEHVLPGHGFPVIGAAREKYLPSLQGELKGCHE